LKSRDKILVGWRQKPLFGKRCLLIGHKPIPHRRKEVD